MHQQNTKCTKEKSLVHCIHIISLCHKPTVYLGCRFSFCFEAVGFGLVTLFELELAQADQAAKAGRTAAGLHKFESCIVHHKPTACLAVGFLFVLKLSGSDL